MQEAGLIEEMSILIIDDSEANTLLLDAVLSKEGFDNINTAFSLEQALKRLEGFPIDLILLSFVLPDVSGLEASKIISQDLRFEDIPIIMVTANTDMQTLKSSFEHGASDYISKPINNVELTARVHSHLIRKQVNDE